MIEDFTHFEAWKKAMVIAENVHALTKSFPKEEQYSLVSQMRRAAVSVAANIAEGFGRYSAADKQHKYVQARGELIELMTFLHYSQRVAYITPNQQEKILELCREQLKILNALVSTMHSRK